MAGRQPTTSFSKLKQIVPSFIHFHDKANKRKSKQTYLMDIHLDEIKEEQIYILEAGR